MRVSESTRGDIRYSRVTGVDIDQYELNAELLGKILGSSVWLSMEDEIKESSSETLTLKMGDNFDINSFLSIGYERVERVWNEGEISVLGDVIVVWPFSMNRIIRLSLFGEKVEKISVVEVESREQLRILQRE